MSTEPNIPTTLPLVELATAFRPLVADSLANDLAGFVKWAWPILYPGRPLIWSWHYDYLCEYLVLVKRGMLRRLIINVPPRTLKSTHVTILFPVWMWLTEPKHNFLMASYTSHLSEQHSQSRRILLQSRRFQEFWGNRFQLSDGCNRIEQFRNNRGGQMIATSVGGTVMGYGCDTAILDDVLSVDQAFSDVERTKTNNWIDRDLRSRLNDPSRGSIILVMQRVHQQDPTGYLLDQEPGVWTHVRIPLEAEEDTNIIFPISGRLLLRQKGDVLQPERFTPEVVAEKKRDRLVWASQYQLRPAPLEGNLIKLFDVRYFDGANPHTGQPDEQLPTNFDMKVISVDCAFKALPTSDYVAILVIGVKGRKRFVLDVVNAHLDAAATEAAIRRLRDKHGPINATIVEDKANGPAVIQRLKANIPGVIEINPKGGKIARMFAAASEWQAGDWYVDRNAAYTPLLVEQLTTFPASRKDDMVDAMTQAACWLSSYQLPTVESHNAFTGEVHWSLNSGVWRTND